MFKNWWSEYSFLVWCCILCVVLIAGCIWSINKEKEAEQKKFNVCMNDIHNVYVCETWARGKDVQYIYIQQ